MLISTDVEFRDQTLATLAAAARHELLPLDRVIPVVDDGGLLHGQPHCVDNNGTLRLLTLRALTALTDACPGDPSTTPTRQATVCNCELGLASPDFDDLYDVLRPAIPAVQWLDAAANVVAGGSVGAGSLPWQPLWLPQAAAELLTDSEQITFPDQLTGRREAALADLSAVAARMVDTPAMDQARDDLVRACATWLADLHRSATDDRHADVGNLHDDALAEVASVGSLPPFAAERCRQAFNAALAGVVDDTSVWALTGATACWQGDTLDEDTQIALALRSFTDTPRVLRGPTRHQWPRATEWGVRSVWMSGPVHLVRVPLVVLDVLAVFGSGAGTPLLPFAFGDQVTADQAFVAAAAAARTTDDVDWPQLLLAAGASITP